MTYNQTTLTIVSVIYGTIAFLVTWGLLAIVYNMGG